MASPPGVGHHHLRILPSFPLHSSSSCCYFRFTGRGSAEQRGATWPGSQGQSWDQNSSDLKGPVLRFSQDPTDCPHLLQSRVKGNHAKTCPPRRVRAWPMKGRLT